MFNKDKEYTWKKSNVEKRFDIYLKCFMENGDKRYLSNIYRVLAEGNKHIILNAAKTLCDCLKSMTFDEVVKMDSMMRDTTSKEWFSNWNTVQLHTFLLNEMSDDEQQAILVFSSFHPNGFIREQAVRMLANYAGSLPYLILRTNDWVLQVRQETKTSIDIRMNCLSTNELITALPFFEKMKNGKRSRIDYDARFFYNKLLEPEQEADLKQGLKSDNQFIRRMCLNALFSSESLDSDLIIKCLKSEKVPFIRYIVYKSLLQLDFPEKQTIINRMLKDKYPRIRRIAFEYHIQQNSDGCFELAEKMLLDKCSEIRENARYVISKINISFNFGIFYQSALENNPNPYSAICGLGETGIKEDAVIVEKYLNHHLNSVVKASMYACFQLDPEKYLTTVIVMLDDERSGISKQAYKLVKDNISDFDAIRDLFLNSRYSHCRQKCAKIMMLATKWQRIIYILELFEDNDERIKTLAQLKLAQWFRNYNRSFTQPSKAQLEIIIQLLNRIILPGSAKKKLELIMRIGK